jgi:hypothetical protein
MTVSEVSERNTMQFYGFNSEKASEITCSKQVENNRASAVSFISNIIIQIQYIKVSFYINQCHYSFLQP